MIYDLNKKNIDDKKLLKKSPLTLKSFIEKLIKKLINNLIIESNIVLKMKVLYNFFFKESFIQKRVNRDKFLKT